MTVNFVSLVYVCLLMCGSVYGNLWNQQTKVICLVNCTEQNQEIFIPIDICKEKCHNITSLTDFEDRKVLQTDLKLSKPELHCRTEYDLFVRWKPWDTDLVYLLEIRNRHTEWSPVTVVTRSNFTFGNLASDSHYQIRVWGIRNEKDVLGPRTSPWLNTLKADFEPLPVTDISLKEMVLRNDHYEAVIQWIPNERDLVCFYDLVVFYNNKDTRIADFRQMEYRKITENFEIRIEELEFDNYYHVAVMTKSGNWERESTKTWYNFTTPTCLEAYADLNKCPPENPVNLTSDEILVNVMSKDDMYTAFYNVTVTWSLPRYIPDYYEIFLIASKMNNLTISGNQTEAVFQTVAVGLYYNVYLTAYSAAGNSETVALQRQITHTRLPTESKQLWWVVTFISFTTIAILTVLATGFCIFHRRAKRKRYERRCKYFEDLEDKAPKNIDCITSETVLVLDDPLQVTDKWELRPERLVLQSVLGEGAFGLVRRAWLRNENTNTSTEVAVKMLKDTPSPEQTRHFLHEIDIMKTVGCHPHLVSILGCCTRPQAGCGMMLVVEYCALGDLQNYLRGAWERMTSQPDTKIQYADLVTPVNSDGVHNLIINKLYDLEISATNQSNLQPSDLLSFARQIAMGMEYLTNLKVLHRDLAARNVLVCADKSVKIADFGLSRDVYRDNMYRKTDNGKLPIRWMALESLTHQIYTTQSDVWSFGILLWEIVTLGGNPYPSVPTNALLKLLKSGYRMECPANCGSELYKVMLSCWKARPKERPTFTELRKSLDSLLESMTMSQYLNLDLVSSTEFASFRMALHDSPSITLKTKCKNSDNVSTERYVHPILLHNAKNTSGTTDISMIIK